jgi:hypothetical protein
MMEAVNICETSVNFNDTTQRDIQEASHLSSTRSTWCGRPTQSFIEALCSCRWGGTQPTHYCGPVKPLTAKII